MKKFIAMFLFMFVMAFVLMGTVNVKGVESNTEMSITVYSIMPNGYLYELQNGETTPFDIVVHYTPSDNWDIWPRYSYGGPGGDSDWLSDGQTFHGEGLYSFSLWDSVTFESISKSVIIDRDDIILLGYDINTGVFRAGDGTVTNNDIGVMFNSSRMLIAQCSKFVYGISVPTGDISIAPWLMDEGIYILNFVYPNFETKHFVLYIDITPPEIKLNNGNLQLGGSASSVTVELKDKCAIDYEKSIYVYNGLVGHFQEGQATTFTNKGFYILNVFDKGGNIQTSFFTVV